MTDKTKKSSDNPNPIVQRFKPRLIKGGKSDAPETPKGKAIVDSELSGEDIAKKLKNLDPEKVKEFDKLVKAMFKAIQAGDDPKMFQCSHCGGFHALDIHCSVCHSDNKAQQAFTMDKLDHMFAIAMCRKCFAVSVAVIQCHGIDPSMVELQKEYAENLKAQKGPEPEPDEKS